MNRTRAPITYVCTICGLRVRVTQELTEDEQQHAPRVFGLHTVTPFAPLCAGLLVVPDARHECQRADMVPLRIVVENLGPGREMRDSERWLIARFWRCTLCNRTYAIQNRPTLTTEFRESWRAEYPGMEWPDIVRQLFDEGGLLAMQLPEKLEEYA